MSDKRRDNKGRLLRNGEVQRADGKYMYRYTDLNGDRKTIYSWKLVDTDKAPEGKRCNKALRDMIKQVQKDLDDGINSSQADKLTVNRLFENFMEVRKDLKKTTRSNYICLYSKHVQDGLGRKRLNAVKHSDIQKMYLSMVQDEGLKVSTVQGVHAILFQLFESAVMDNIIRINPAENVLKNLRKKLGSEQEKRHALSEEEQARLIDYVYNSKQHFKWGALLTVLLGTGMRIGEALGLRWCDCDFKNGLISVNHTLLYKPNEDGSYEYRISEPKTKAGIRVIPMFSDVKKALLKAKKVRRNPNLKSFTVDGYSDFVFLNSKGKVFTPAAVFDALQSITYDYNREESVLAQKEQREPCYLPKFSAHILRHTFCTRMCENEPNLKIIQDVMGHKNIRTTMDVYNEATELKKKESFINIDGKFKLA